MSSITVRKRRHVRGADYEDLQGQLKTIREQIQEGGGVVLATQYWGPPGSACEAVVRYCLPTPARMNRGSETRPG